MPHIAEGLLHAHLDGALEPAERDQWAAAEAHLAECEDCRRRLEEAREIRDAAAALLAGAATPAAERPSFDALVAEAGRRSGPTDGAFVPGRSRYEPPRRWWRSPAKLAWAASLVLAVGAGWIGRQLLVEEGADAPLLMESRAAPERPGPAELAQPREAESLEDAVSGVEAAKPTEAGESAERDVSAEREEGARFRAPPTPAPESTQENGLEGRADAAAREAPARTAEQGEAVEPGVALAPQALPRRVPEGPCYGVEPAAGPVGVLRLRADGTAALYGDGRPLVGFWERPTADSVAVRLTGGEGWMELGLGPADLERSARDCPSP